MDTSDTSALRNFKDFLQLYNKMTEKCFAQCINNTNSRQLDIDEIECVDGCALKFIKFNNKLMGNFLKVQTAINYKRIKEAEESEINNMKEIAIKN